jgi:endonuclease III
MPKTPPHLRKIIAGLKKGHPRATCALRHRNAFELLIATILSAQCTDERVNRVTPGLFNRFPDAGTLGRAPLPEVEKIIQSTGFFRQKARSIVMASRAIAEKHGGKVPQTMEDLTALPGVGRKTANVFLGTAYGIPAGIVVDTHVRRLANRMGFTTQNDPEKIEQDLMRIVPKSDWIWFAHAMIHHGRGHCRAVNPQCPECPMNKDCPFPVKSGVGDRPAAGKKG